MRDERKLLFPPLPPVDLAAWEQPATPQADRGDGLREVQRYSLELDEAGQAYMELDPDGRWVLLKEVARLRESADQERT